MHWLDDFIFPRTGWVDVREEWLERRRIEKEFRRELGKDHPLALAERGAVAHRRETGEVVVRLTKKRAAFARLTWAGGQSVRGAEVVVCTTPDGLGDLVRRRPPLHWLDSMVFPDRGWDDLRNHPERAEGLERELRAELGTDDPRSTALLEVVASAWPSDDIVVKTRSGAALVHLTWRGKQERPGWPQWSELSQGELEAELWYGATGYDDDWF